MEFLYTVTTIAVRTREMAHSDGLHVTSLLASSTWALKQQSKYDSREVTGSYCYFSTVFYLVLRAASVLSCA